MTFFSTQTGRLSITIKRGRADKLNNRNSKLSTSQDISVPRRGKLPYVFLPYVKLSYVFLTFSYDALRYEIVVSNLNSISIQLTFE